MPFGVTRYVSAGSASPIIAAVYRALRAELWAVDYGSRFEWNNFDVGGCDYPEGCRGIATTLGVRGWQLGDEWNRDLRRHARDGLPRRRAARHRLHCSAPFRDASAALNQPAWRARCDAVMDCQPSKDVSVSSATYYVT
jgi:hypothetical protein